MAHPLEFLKPDSQFTAYEVIEIYLTGLAREMWAAQALVAEKDPAEDSSGLCSLLESWRNELFTIRGAVRKIAPATDD